MTAARASARRVGRRALARGRLRREAELAAQIPYRAHVSESLVRTTQGDFLQLFEIRGVAFEHGEAASLEALHERLHVFLRNLASPQVAVWTHLIRDRLPAAEAVSGTPLDAAPTSFAAALEAKYAACVSEARWMRNRWYLSLVYRPVAGALRPVAERAAASRWAAWLGRETPAEAGAALLHDALEACAGLRQLVLASLAEFEPRALGCEELLSEPLSVLAELVNGEAQPVRVPRGPIAESLGRVRLTFGPEVIEYRGATESRFGAMLGIKEYPPSTTPGQFDALLAAPFALVLTQSFTYLSKGAAQSLLMRQQHQMVNAGDFAVSQAEALTAALDAVASNEFVMGDHHASLLVLSEPVAAARSDEDTAGALARLDEHIGQARGLLGDAAVTTAREDMALEAAFWAQLPGQFALRSRKAAISSRNFAALVPWHAYPTGRARGNHWGESLCVLKTAARTAFHFSLHASDPRDADGGSRRDCGHTLICGPTGSGKTVFIGFLLSLLARRGITQVVFDKDRGLEILLRALGGEYLPLVAGEPTGCNPLALEATPANVEFLRGWLLALLDHETAPLSVAERADVEAALAAVLDLPPPLRRLSRLIEYLDATRSEGPYGRLTRWCESTGGELAWVFDHPVDAIVPKLQGAALVGFDVTEFLDWPHVRAPLIAYLFHLVKQLIDGRRFVCWLDEFWKLVGDAGFREFAHNGPKTWRKLNAVMVLATQSASDVLAAPIAATLIEQTATKIFFPNLDATRADYCDGFGLSAREWQLLAQELTPGSRRFLVRQGRDSVVCELDLRGFEAELAVISGRAENVALMRRLRAECGEAPADWLPWYYVCLDADDRAPARAASKTNQPAFLHQSAEHSDAADRAPARAASQGDIPASGHRAAKPREAAIRVDGLLGTRAAE